MMFIFLIKLSFNDIQTGGINVTIHIVNALV